jgi:hypothetical protein
MIRCANGHENPDGTPVCGECGLPLAAAGAEPASGSFWARQEARNSGVPTEPPPEPPPAPPVAPAPPAAPAASAPPPPADPPLAAWASTTATTPTDDPDDADAADEIPAVVAATTRPSGDASDVGDRGGVIALVGAVLLVFGAFLPWARASGSLFYVTKDGIDGDAGVIMLVLAVVIGLIVALTLLKSAPSRVAALIVLLGGLAGVGFSIYEMFDIHDAFGDLFERAGSEFDFDARVGVGLYLCLLASALIVVGAVLAILQADRARRSE